MVYDFDHTVVEFFGGVSGSERRREFENLFAESEENKHLFEQDCELWLASEAAFASESFSAEKAYKRFKNSHKIPHKAVSPIWRYAFIIVLAVGLSFASFDFGRRIVKDGFVENVAQNPLGTKSKITLPDGTLVCLNGGSRLSYSQGFGINDRTVVLEGEAFFEVTKNASLPFVVNTGDLRVKVLGTKFNCRDFEEDKTAVVTLLEGRVELSNFLSDNEASVYLAPNESYILDKTNGESEIVAQNASNTAMWTDGILFFDEERLEDIAKALERCYGVEIGFQNDNLRRMRVYGNFNTRKQSIEDVLETLSATNGLCFTRKDNTLYYTINQ